MTLPLQRHMLTIVNDDPSLKIVNNDPYPASQIAQKARNLNVTFGIFT